MLHKLTGWRKYLQGLSIRVVEHNAFMPEASSRCWKLPAVHIRFSSASLPINATTVSILIATVRGKCYVTLKRSTVRPNVQKRIYYQESQLLFNTARVCDTSNCSLLKGHTFPICCSLECVYPYLVLKGDAC